MFRLLLIISVSLAVIIGLSKLTNREEAVSDTFDGMGEAVSETVGNAAEAAGDIMKRETDVEEAPIEERDDALDVDAIDQTQLGDDTAAEDLEAAGEQVSDAAGDALQDAVETMEDVADATGEAIEEAVEEVEAAVEENAEEAQADAEEAADDAAPVTDDGEEE